MCHSLQPRSVLKGNIFSNENLEDAAKIVYRRLQGFAAPAPTLRFVFQNVCNVRQFLGERGDVCFLAGFPVTWFTSFSK